MKMIKDRYNILISALFAAGVLILIQLVNLQIINGERYSELSQQKLLRERKIPAPRGNIYDRNGIIIAHNRQSFNVHMVYTNLDENERSQMFLNLVKIFEKNGDGFYKSLSNYLTFDPIAFGTAVNKSKVEMDKWIRTAVVNRGKDAEYLNSADDIFKYLREKYKIGNGFSNEEAYKIMLVRYETQIKGYDIMSPILLAKDVSMETVAEIEERHNDFPGITIEMEPLRKYNDAYYAAHVIGTVRGISAEDYNRLKNDGYSMNDIIGQEGIERQAEKYLKGRDGIKKVEMDAAGRLIEDMEANPGMPGNNIELTLDMKLQKTAMESLEKNIRRIRELGGKNNFGDASAGAVVAMDVNNGEVLAMASYPSYDPSIYIGSSGNIDAQRAIADLNNPKNQLKPLFNRAVAGVYTPGSTFKPLVGIAGLEEGVITPESIIYDEGTVNIGGWTFTCLEYRNGLGAHGALNLERALATSCNIFFHKLGVQIGIDNIGKWAKHFGLGERQGIDIPGESKGVLASKQYKQEVYKDDWRPADTAQASIGQSFNTFTPLQLANYISAIANGGKLFKPYLIKRITEYDGSVVNEMAPEYKQIPVTQANIETAKKGMVAVANSIDGTAATIFDDLPFKVAGKTGTAETGYESTQSSNALFVCYAPADNPKIAVAVVVEHGVWGAYAAPVAHDILKEYFASNESDNNDDLAKFDDNEFTK